MILLVAILAFGGLAIDAETTPDYGEDYGEDYWPTAMAATTLDPWPPSAARCRRLEEEEEKANKEWSYCNDLLHPWYPTTPIWRRMNNPAKNDFDAAKEMKKIRAEIEKLKKIMSRSRKSRSVTSNRWRKCARKCERKCER